MARIARVVVPGVPHHVTQRGNRRQKTFFCDNDYQYYVSLIARFCCEAKTEVWAYCLMPNHVHLIMVPAQEDGLRKPLAATHRTYTREINNREDWRGHLWQERFYSVPMDERHLIAAVRYVERNPVEAGLCERPTDWRWSSAAAHSLGRNDGLVQVDPMLNMVGDWQTYLREQTDSELLDAMKRGLRTGRPLGSDAFIRTLEVKVGRCIRPRKRGRPHSKK